MTRRLAAALAAAAAVAAIAMPAALGQVPQDAPVGTPLTMTPAPDPQSSEVHQHDISVSGDFKMNGPNGTIEEIDVSVKSTGPQPGPGTDTQQVCAGGQPPCGGSDAPFTYAFLPHFTLDYNGPYEVTATAYGSDVFVQHSPGSAPALDFKLTVPPAKPAKVSAKYDAPSGFMIVSWDRNAEPDIRNYVYARKGPSDTDYKPFGPVPLQPGRRVAIADRLSPGDYQYKVDAVRAGADPNDPKSIVDSGFSDPIKATVPTPPPGGPQPTTPPPAPSFKPIAKSQLPKTQSFSSGSSSKSSGSTTLTTESVSPDAGFARGSADVTSTIPGGADDSGQAIAILPKSKHGSSNRVAIFGPVAGGAVLFMFAFHLRYLKGRLDQIPPPA